MTAANKQPASLALVMTDGTNNTGASSFPSMTLLQDGTGPDTGNHVHRRGRQPRSGPLGHPYLCTVDSRPRRLGHDRIHTAGRRDHPVEHGFDHPLQPQRIVQRRRVAAPAPCRFQFTGLTTPQDVQVDYGTTGTFNGISMVGNGTSIAARPDRTDSSPATCSMWRSRPPATCRASTATARPGHSTRSGSRCFPTKQVCNERATRCSWSHPTRTTRSQPPPARQARASSDPGAIENSNVDIAEEFVKLITAQRGFQANSRVITTADEILAELVNIVRSRNMARLQ